MTDMKNAIDVDPEKDIVAWDNWVLVEKEKVHSMSGLVLPESIKAPFWRVHSVGPALKGKIAPKDMIVYANGVKLEIKGREFSFVREDNICGIVRHPVVPGPM